MHFFRSLGAFALSATAVATLSVLTLSTVVAAVTGTMLILVSPAAATEPDTACVSQIKQIMADGEQGGPYELTTLVDSPYGDTSTVAEYLPPQGLHMRTEMNGGVFEYTYLDGKGWTNFGSAWTDMDPAMVAGFAKVFDGSALDIYDHLSNAQCFGPLVYENRPVLKFTYTYDNGTGPIENEFYADNATHLPAKVVTVSKTADATITVTSTYRYDDSITVTAPKAALF